MGESLNIYLASDKVANNNFVQKVINNKFTYVTGQMLTGGTIGGATSFFRGGTFGAGFRNGAITAGLNSGLHPLGKKIQQEFRKMSGEFWAKGRYFDKDSGINLKLKAKFKYNDDGIPELTSFKFKDERLFSIIELDYADYIHNKSGDINLDIIKAEGTFSSSFTKFFGVKLNQWYIEFDATINYFDKKINVINFEAKNAALEFFID